MMRSCYRCLENRWGFNYDDDSGYVMATCQLCGYEVEWLSKRARKIQKGKPIGTGLTVVWDMLPHGDFLCDGVPATVRYNEKGHIWVAKEGSRSSLEGREVPLGAVELPRYKYLSA